MHLRWILVFLVARNALGLSADEIVKRADEARGPEGTYSFQVQVIDKDADKSASETMYRVYSKDLKYTLIDTIAPERLRGRKLLMRGNDLWLYLPTVKRPTRVSFQQRLTGEVSNGDIARMNFSEDYTAELDGEEVIDGKKCHRLKLSARHKEVTYHALRYWVEKANLRPARTEFFAISGKLLKTASYKEFGEVMGKQRATGMVITDGLRPTRQSHLKYSAHRREQLNETFFSKETLAE